MQPGGSGIYNVTGHDRQMSAIWERIRQYLKSLAGALEKWRWLILVSIGILLLWVEIYEYLAADKPGQQFHFIEVILFALLLSSTGILTELFSRSNQAYKQAARILSYKHKIIKELISDDDWRSLMEKVPAIPSQIVPAMDAYLVMVDPITMKPQVDAYWTSVDATSRLDGWDPLAPCRICLEETHQTFHLCRMADEPGSYFAYRMDVSSQEYPSAFLKFRVMPEYKLSAVEEEIFSGIRDEIIVAIQTSQNRRKMSDLLTEEVVLAERRSISTYVHDQLGQNLGFLHLKLDQLSMNDVVNKHKEIRSEISHLREVASKSYDIVRDILKKIRPRASPDMTHLLREHAKSVARRARLKLDFKSNGTPIILEEVAQQTIFLIFREMVRNVEKHAEATILETVLTWDQGFLEIMVRDNGKGFDPAAISTEDHYGMQIMHERVASLGGVFNVSSQGGQSGSVVSISVPLALISVVP